MSDSNLPIVSFTADKTFIQEGEEFSWFFTLDKPVPVGGLTLNIPILDNNDPSPGDINFNIAGSTNVSSFAVVRESDAVVGFQVTLAEGATEARLVNRGALDDLVDIDEIATVALAQGSNYAVSPTQNLVSFTINDPVGTPTEGAGGIRVGTPIVSFTTDKSIVLEGETFTWNFNFSEPAPAGGVVLNLPILDNNDPAPGDVRYNIEGSTNISSFEFIVENGVSINYRVTIASGVTEATVVNRARVDAIAEMNETFTVALAGGVNYAPSPTAKLVPVTIRELPISTNFVVNSLADVISATDGVITLREAINAANSQAGQNTIEFNLPSGSQIDLTEMLEISDDLIINGGGVTIAGNGTFDNFFVYSANIVFDGLTVTNGRAGIHVASGGIVTVVNSTLRNNVGDGLEIGGNYNIVTVTNSAVINNTDDGIDFDGGINTLNVAGLGVFGNGNNGFEIEAIDSTIAIANSGITSNGFSGMFFKVAADNNKVNISNVGITSNVNDGIKISSNDNTFSLTSAAFDNNGGDGVEIDGADNFVTINNASLSNNSDNGIDVNGSNQTLLVSNVGINGNDGNGFEIDATDSAIAFSNVSFSNSGANGVKFDIGADNNRVTIGNASINSNADDGIKISSLGNTVNLFSIGFNSNGEDGLDIDGADNTAIANAVSFTNNLDDGIDVNGSNQTFTAFNLGISGNSGNGVQIDATDSLLTFGNSSITSNDVNGAFFDVFSSDNQLTLVNSSLSGNRGVAIADRGSDNIISSINNGSTSSYPLNAEFGELSDPLYKSGSLMSKTAGTTFNLSS